MVNFKLLALFICFTIVTVEAQSSVNWNSNLIKSIAENKPEFVKEALENGANVNLILDLDNLTPLMVASYEGKKEIVEILLNKGAKVNIQNTQGFTSLMMASREGYLDVVKLLISYGANLNYINYYNTTALTLAIINNHNDIVKLLLEKGAKVNIPTTPEDNPLDVARDESNAQAEKLLEDIIEVNLDISKFKDKDIDTQKMILKRWYNKNLINLIKQVKVEDYSEIKKFINSIIVGIDQDKVRKSFADIGIITQR